MIPKIKICGLTREEDARTALVEGADFLGMIFADSPRRVDPERAAKIMMGSPDFRAWVAVFVDEKRDRILEIIKKLGISFVQLHGDESPDDCAFFSERGIQVIKAVRVADADSLIRADSFPVPFILLDTYFPNTYGGTGHPFDWTLLKDRKFKAKVLLSGGLNAINIHSALQTFQPHAVDVSSGVESAPGIKDPGKIRTFIREIKSRDHARN